MIFSRLRRKKKPEGPQIARSEFLQLIPVRNPELTWEKDEEGKITIIFSVKKPEEQPKKQPEEQKKKEVKRKRRKIRLFPDVSMPAEKKFQLDNVGSIVWELCDSKNKVKDIVDHLSDKYKMLSGEAETALNSYFNLLAKRKLMAFILPEETSARLREQREKEERRKQ